MTAPADRITEEVAEEFQARTGVPMTSGPEKGDGKQVADIWYFAFGSNMCSSVLKGRRMIHPAEAVPARLPGFRLVFNLAALPYREPAMASVVPMDGTASVNGAATADGAAANGATARHRGPAEPGSSGDEQVVHGVAYRITQTQWDYICETEGAAGCEDSDYTILQETAEAYDGRLIAAYTLSTSDRAVRFNRGRKLLPSKRYANLLRRGAREHGLHGQYQLYLDDLPHYRAKGWGQKLGAVLFGSILVVIFALFALLRLQRKLVGIRGSPPQLSGTRPKPLLPRVFHMVIKLSWSIHDWVEPVLGSGAH